MPIFTSIQYIRRNIKDIPDIPPHSPRRSKDERREHGVIFPALSVHLPQNLPLFSSLMLNRKLCSLMCVVRNKSITLNTVGAMPLLCLKRNTKNTIPESYNVDEWEGCEGRSLGKK